MEVVELRFGGSLSHSVGSLHSSNFNPVVCSVRQVSPCEARCCAWRDYQDICHGTGAEMRPSREAGMETVEYRGGMPWGGVREARGRCVEKRCGYCRGNRVESFCRSFLSIDAFSRRL